MHNLYTVVYVFVFNNIIKQISKTIEERISKHSSTEEIFNEAAKVYEEALKKSGYNSKLEYNPINRQIDNEHVESRNRKRKIIWFNPQFSKNVSTKIGHYFLNLLDKHFPKEHRYHRIFNRNNVKISYSCTKNMKTIISNHNKSILNKSENPNQKTCNCINKNNCPLNGECQADNIIYQATINSNKPNYEPQNYIGLAETNFKKRYANHKKSFNHQKYENDTVLSKELWKLKSENFTTNITWKILRRCAPVNRAQVNLCISEKLEIATYPG